MLERIRAMSSNLMRENHISQVILGEADVAVIADAGHVQQIMMNLILNAMQAMPDGGLLTIRARRESPMGVIEISDTGTGISPEILCHVTEPFFTTRHDGTGLGLSVSKQLIELNGGKLDFFSEPGQGTTVSLYLPLAE